MLAGTTLLLLEQTPVNNPGFLSRIPSPIFTVDASISTTNFYFSASGTQSIWLVAFNFNKHALLAQEGRYSTGVSFVNITGPDSMLVASSNSHYNGVIGVVLTGGTINLNYSLTVGITLDNSQVISSTLNISIKQ